MEIQRLDIVARYKYHYIMERVGSAVLQFILMLGTTPPTSPPGIRFDDYLEDARRRKEDINYTTLNSKERKDVFNKTHKDQFSKHLMWDNFDISLLYMAIRLGNRNVARLHDGEWDDENYMEGLVQAVRNERSRFIHDTRSVTTHNFAGKLNDLRDLAMKTLSAAQIKYGVPDENITEIKNKVLKEMNDTYKGFSGVEAINMVLNDLPSFVRECRIYLKPIYRITVTCNPLSFLSVDRSISCIHIQDIYCETDLEEAERPGQIARMINCRDILTLPQQQTSPSPSIPKKKPRLIMINGQASSGKSALLQYIMSEWIKDANDCKIKTLADYDFVFMVRCCYENAESLQRFLVRSLPGELCGFQDYLMPLFKGCSNLLFLIDGIDEMESSVEKLVREILEEFEGMPEATIICTARPERVDGFLHSVSDNYQKWELKMTEIKPECRTSFVLKYYDHIAPLPVTDRNTVREYMERYGWKDHFGAPLNLLFVTFVLHTEVNGCKLLNTHSTLYYGFHIWNLELLQARLARHPDTTMMRMDRDDEISDILHDLYSIALNGLLEDKLTLSDEDVQVLRKSCTNRGILDTEVMMAFLCRRETVVQHNKQLTYSLPNKSFQEYYAAKFIVTELNRFLYERRKLNTDQSQPTSDNGTQLVSNFIKTLLRKPSGKKLKSFGNLLLHVLEVLSMSNFPALPETTQAVMHLVAAAGVKDYNIWLSVLDDHKKNTPSVRIFAHNITKESIDSKWVKMSTSSFTGAEVLLSLIPSRTVWVELRRSISIQKLDNIFKRHTCKRLDLRQHFQHPVQPEASDTSLDLWCWSMLEWFVGNLSPDGILKLQHCKQLKILLLSVDCVDYFDKLASAVTRIRPSLPHLCQLKVHVPFTVPRNYKGTTSLPDLPYHEELDFHGVTLVLSSLTAKLVKNACQFMVAVQPKNGYALIKFPECELDHSTWKDLLVQMSDAGVRVRHGLRLPLHPRFVWGMRMEEVNQERELYQLSIDKHLGPLTRETDYALWH